MAVIDLKIGHGVVPVEYDEARFHVLGSDEDRPSLSDAQIGARLDAPIGSPPLEEIVEPGQSVLIVVPDATRSAGSGQIVNLVVRRLIANGTAPGDIRVIFATGIHRKVTDEEKAQILTPFIAQRIKTIDHDPRDLANLVRVGETSTGIPVELNRALLEHDRVILVGGVTFHYFAGFTGGRKLICPGLASSRTIAATHKLAFDCERRSRRDGVDTALLDGNAVHEAFMEAVAFAPPAFAINTIVNGRGEATDLFCGDWKTSHAAACRAFDAANSLDVNEKRPCVVVSCGGAPYDINLIQAHKALDAAARACTDGGTVFFLAECAHGLGRDDFLQWFDAANSDDLADRLCEKYQVNGQTAWSLFRKAEQFDIRIATDLDASAVDKIRLRTIGPADIDLTTAGGTGYILPFGARCHIRGR